MSENSEKPYGIEDLEREPYCVAKLESGDALYIGTTPVKDGFVLYWNRPDDGTHWKQASFTNKAAALRVVRCLMDAKRELPQRERPLIRFSNKEFLDLAKENAELKTQVKMLQGRVDQAEMAYEDGLQDLGRKEGMVEGLKWAMERMGKNEK